MKDVDGAQLLLGRGKIYFDRLDSSGNPTGERFVGNATTLQVGTTDDLREKFSSATASAPRMKSVNVRRAQDFDLTLDHFTPENVALALMGDTSVLAQGSGSAVDEAMTPTAQGRFFKLEFRQVSAVVITGTGGTPTYVAGTDYDVDAVTGRIYIIVGGAIAAATVLEVSYDYAVDVSQIVRSGVSNTIEGFMRFIGDPATGPVYEVEIWKISFNPEGVIGLITDEFAEFSLKGKVEDDSANHPGNPFFQKILRA